MTEKNDDLKFKTFLTYTSQEFSKKENSNQLMFSVKNESNEKKSFCIYGTPFEGIVTSLLKVTDEHGTELPYNGILAKRAAPGKDDYIEIEGNSIISTFFTLEDSYIFPASGKYTIQFIGNENMNKLPDSNILTVLIKS